MQLDKLMKQAQEMQKKMQQAQKEIEEIEETGESGAGTVSVTMNGRHRVVLVTLGEGFDEEPKEVKEDLLVAAYNAAAQKIEERSKKKLASITEGMQLPEGFGGNGTVN